MSGNEAWLTTDKNRYCPGEQVIAVLHMEGSFAGARIKAMLTDPSGNTVALESDRIESGICYIYAEVDISGAYNLTSVIENDTEAQYICSTCFFVGECEAAIPKASTVPLLFGPEMWEEPDYFKLISFYLMSEGKPVPNAPVALTFRNKNGRLEKELRTDRTGNVFFAPYMAGTYCLVSKVSLHNTGSSGSVEITAAFSVAMTESTGKRSRSTKNKYKI